MINDCYYNYINKHITYNKIKEIMNKIITITFNTKNLFY